MRDSFSAALTSVQQQAEGWLLYDNLRHFSAASPEEVQRFLEAWSALPDRYRTQLAGALADVAGIVG